jgi:hypothetical protein
LRAANFQPLELGQQVAARRRCQALQIVLNPIGLKHGTPFPQFGLASTIAYREAGIVAPRSLKLNP